MEKNIDVVALGELLIDFTENGVNEHGNPVMEANPGGAPCNVLSMLTNLGKSTAFIGKVGKDMFGKQLRDTIKKVGINDTGLIEDENVNTTLAFVHTLPDGDREFSFYRNPGADMMLTKEDLPIDLLKDCKVFHFGTLSMTAPNCFEATKEAVRIAKNAGALITFDPNIREPLWDSLEDAKEKTKFGLANCDVLKISDNEIQWLTGEQDYATAVKKIKEEYNIPLILVSLGKEGSMAFTDSASTSLRTFDVNTIETTGAGDTFFASCINYVLEKGLDLSETDLKKMLRFANAAAAIVTTRKGALTVMPTKEEVENLIDTTKKGLLADLNNVNEELSSSRSERKKVEPESKLPFEDPKYKIDLPHSLKEELAQIVDHKLFGDFYDEASGEYVGYISSQLPLLFSHLTTPDKSNIFSDEVRVQGIFQKVGSEKSIDVINYMYLVYNNRLAYSKAFGLLDNPSFKTGNFYDLFLQPDFSQEELDEMRKKLQAAKEIRDSQTSTQKIETSALREDR